MTGGPARREPGAPAPAEHVPSPCVRVCAIDRGTLLCRGCKRSLEEIRAWGGMGPDARRALLDELRSR